MSNQLQDYNYHYPEELVAQQPLAQRHASKMMVVPAQGTTIHSAFSQLPKFLKKNDLIIANNTQVIPSRLFVKKNTGGLVEVFLLKKLHNNTWKCLLSPTRGLQEGMQMAIYSRNLALTQDIKIKIESLKHHNFQISFSSQKEENFALQSFGEMPLPPYIKRKGEQINDLIRDKERYQTLFASQPGAIAAPTAGLHFSEQIKQALQQAGIPITPVTLHVGAGTFTPIKCDTIDQHPMHEEYYEIPDQTLEAIQTCRQNQGRIVVIGTTTLRALESYGLTNKKQGWTSLFIRPGFQFKYTDMLLTNFHQPKSSLLVLVSALMGRERILAAYEEAIQRKYRLFSYGDCMLLVKKKNNF